MSNRAIDWAYEQSISPMAKKFLLVTLANRANKDFICWPSIRKLAADLGTTKVTIHRYLKELEAEGLIARQSRTRDNGSKTSSVFTVLVPTEYEQPRQDHQLNEVVTGASLPLVTPALHPEPSDINPQENTPHNPPKGDAPSEQDFDEFWAIFPHRQNRPSKRKIKPKYLKAVSRAGGHRQFMRAVRAYAADRAKQEGARS